MYFVLDTSLPATNVWVIPWYPLRKASAAGLLFPPLLPPLLPPTVRSVVDSTSLPFDNGTLLLFSNAITLLAVILNGPFVSETTK